MSRLGDFGEQGSGEMGRRLIALLLLMAYCGKTARSDGAKGSG
jgi:hypothetical protein